MEGVEDIPGTALTEGITWGWESYPEYLDVIEKHDLAIDVGSQVAHGAVRAYAMGERGARTSRPHPRTSRRWHASCRRPSRRARSASRRRARSATGPSTASRFPAPIAAEDELFGLGRAMAAGGRAVFELAPQGVAGEDIIAPKKELEWMQRLGAEIDRPISFGMIQVDAAPGPLARTTGHLGGGARGGQRVVSPDRRATVRHAVRLPRPSRVHPSSDLPSPEGRVQPRGAGAASRRSRGQGGDPVRGRSAAGSERCCSTTCSRLCSTRSAGSTRSAIRPTTSRRPTGPSQRSPASAARTRWPRCTT